VRYARTPAAPAPVRSLLSPQHSHGYWRCHRMRSTIALRTEGEPMPEEGAWTKIGVVIGAAVLIVSYAGVAAGTKWWPFERVSEVKSAGHTLPGKTPTTSSPRPTAPSSPTLTTSPSSTPLTGSVGATFLNVTWVKATSPAYYVYTIEIRFFGLTGQSCTVDWQTVDNSSGGTAGTSGDLTTGALQYNDDSWTGTVYVTAPLGSYHGMQWSTKFHRLRAKWRGDGNLSGRIIRT
jgi:hypothetical protein